MKMLFELLLSGTVDSVVLMCREDARLALAVFEPETFFQNRENLLKILRFVRRPLREEVGPVVVDLAAESTWF